MAGRLSYVRHEAGVTYYSYNPLGEVTAVFEQSKAPGDVCVTRYGYDSAGRMISMQYPSGRIVRYVYGAAALYPSSIEVDEEDGSGQPATRVLVRNMTYDADGQLAGFTDEHNQVSFAATWDLAGQARRRTYDSPRGRFDWDVSERDGNGNILSAMDLATSKRLGTGQQPLVYDEQDRLVHAVGEGLRGYQDCTYEYDLAGNRTEDTCYDKAMSYLYDAGSNRLSAISWQGPVSCDPSTPRITRSIERDARGRQTMAFRSKFPLDAADAVSLGYGPNGRLVSVDTDGQAPSEITYGYDHRNQRVVKSDGVTTAHFTYDNSGLLLAEEREGELLEYVYLKGMLVSVTSSPGTPGSKTWIAATDHLGTPMRLFEEEAGEIVWAADYEAFGRAYEYVPGSRQSPTITLSLRFPGQYADDETGLHYNWHRYYDPEVGRYGQGDPINIGTVMLEMGGTAGAQEYVERLLNPQLEQPYAYAVNAPLTYVDPDGRNAAAAGAGVLLYCGVRPDVCQAAVTALGAAVMVASAAIVAAICAESTPKNGCPPCPPNPPGETDTNHSHYPCPGIHWHYRVYNQIPSTCECKLGKRLFGGCGPAPF